MWPDLCGGAELFFVRRLVAVGASWLARREGLATGTISAPGTPLGRAEAWGAPARGEEMPCPPRTAHRGPVAAGPPTRRELGAQHHPREP